MRTEFISTGMYLPDRVVTNDDLAKMMETSDEWIRARTGIEERRWVREGQLTSDLALEATKMALDRADMRPSDLDAIIFATLSPEYIFPGSGVLLQAKLGVSSIPCLDVRNQCSGFIYGLSVADAWIKTGQYKRVLLVGAEVQSAGLDTTTRGRDLTVLFGDGAGVAILGPIDAPERGVLSTHLFADGSQAKLLWCDLGGAAHIPRITHELIDQGLQFPVMRGNDVYSHAARLMPEAARVALGANGLALDDVRLLISHQANLRILETVQKRLGLRDDQVFNNVQRYGNTTAATIPIALHEALDQGRLARGDVLILTAFGGGLTWASAAIRW
jgi:3-oxoacyl-[acyl-carrier-protein] synthase III